MVITRKQEREQEESGKPTAENQNETEQAFARKGLQRTPPNNKNKKQPNTNDNEATLIDLDTTTDNPTFDSANFSATNTTHPNTTQELDTNSEINNSTLTNHCENSPAPPLIDFNMTTDLSRVRLPNFNKNDPDMWFDQIERIFRRHGVSTEIDQADLLIGGVDSEILTCVRCLVLTKPPPSDIYTQIKSGILTNFGTSKEQRLRQLIKGEVLNGKPSFILTQLRNIANGECGDEVLRSLFMEHLPALHRQILAPSSTKNLTESASIADKITEEIQPHSTENSNTTSVAAIANSATNHDVRIDAIMTELKNIKEQMNNWRGRDQHRGHSRGRSSSRNGNGRSKSRPRDTSDLCWYHRKFKQEAKKCQSPCTWKKPQNTEN
ncbi:uncharacterized protein LOC127285367 [Leptopilina boulardi]|uniref:uncharacterized protein LOC127285367 n=1 Tax=Leptopilina boulardi TaxID=63433 RepID=UPI0021F5895B|nr:uncharacterized protein LOC127285367 [Leptopilina boulardi]